MENTIRWRTVFDDEGNAVQQSNARMVRWSDGSLSLYLGAEVFDVYRQPLQVLISPPNHGAPTLVEPRISDILLNRPQLGGSKHHPTDGSRS